MDINKELEALLLKLVLIYDVTRNQAIVLICNATHDLHKKYIGDY